jgi:hypothetical protein
VCRPGALLVDPDRVYRALQAESRPSAADAAVRERVLHTCAFVARLQDWEMDDVAAANTGHAGYAHAGHAGIRHAVSNALWVQTVGEL